MHYARRQPVEEAANGAREDKYMACTRFSKVRRGGERDAEKERRKRSDSGRREREREEEEEEDTQEEGMF